MSIKYNILKNKDLKNTKNYALFCNEHFKILNFKDLGLSNQTLISDLIQNNKDKRKDFLYLNLSKKQNLLILKMKITLIKMMSQ